eukprot:TRINITY_DN3264_c0_g1_i6.p1 TRINITY_DN3264_c0_g1~~TRINITY_DN3264_c0_g1_i6.p1  ORF type:complete len:397 (+),score=124.68 TRINITY_DN3264_c0_g1_i6:256-1446(+)
MLPKRLALPSPPRCCLLRAERRSYAEDEDEEGADMMNKTEINLQRLIRSCETMVAQSIGVGKAMTPADAKTFAHYLDVLRQQLAELKTLYSNNTNNSNANNDQTSSSSSSSTSSSASSSSSSPQLVEYTRKIEYLSDLINYDKLSTHITLGPAAARLTNNSSSSSSSLLSHKQKTEELQMRMKARSAAEHKNRSNLLGQDHLDRDVSNRNNNQIRNNNNSDDHHNNDHNNKKGHDDDYTSSQSAPSSSSSSAYDRLSARNKQQRGGDGRASLFGSMSSSSSSSSSATRSNEEIEAMLQAEREAQEAVTEDLVGMVASLKQHSVGISRRVQSDNKKLDDLNVLAESNNQKIERENQRLKEISQQSSWSFLSMCLILVFVAGVFVMTYMFIKLFPKVK